MTKPSENFSSGRTDGFSALIRNEVIVNRSVEDWFARIPSSQVRWFVLLMLVAVLSSRIFSGDTGSSLVGSSYDMLIKQRLLAPPQDSDILILDIDEVSLHKMSADYGRWPWPRETLASALDYLERSGAQAVVFDILFADSDVLNPVSDAVFADAVSRSRSSFFPVLRLDAALDAKSEVRADMLLGFAVGSASLEADAVKTRAAPRIAVIPPVFSTVIETKRLGFHNIYPDNDGVNRHYRLWEDVGSDWRLLSLPTRLATTFKWPLPDEPDQLLELPLKPDAYQTISFVDVWQASQSQAESPLAQQVRGKIVIIGSSAPSLFDVKVTPLSPIQPGVQVLANAIDNVKNNRFLQTLGKPAQWVLSIFLLAVMAYASRRLPMSILRWAILIAPTALIGVSYLSLNVGQVFVDLTGAASQAFVFFSAMTVYSAWRVQHFAGFPFFQANEKVVAVVVIDAKSTKFNLNELIDALSPYVQKFAIVQSGFTAGVAVAAGGPFCAFVVADQPIDELGLRAALGIAAEGKMKVVIPSNKGDLSFVEHKDDVGHLAWRYIGDALVEWKGV